MKVVVITREWADGVVDIFEVATEEVAEDRIQWLNDGIPDEYLLKYRYARGARCELVEEQFRGF